MKPRLILAGARRIRLDDGRELEYDLLSLNLGSDIRRHAAVLSAAHHSTRGDRHA